MRSSVAALPAPAHKEAGSGSLVSLLPKCESGYRVSCVLRQVALYSPILNVVLVFVTLYLSFT